MYKHQAEQAEERAITHLSKVQWELENSGIIVFFYSVMMINQTSVE